MCLRGLKKTCSRYWKRVDKHTKVFDCGFMNIVPSITQKYRLIRVLGLKQIQRRLAKNQRQLWFWISNLTHYLTPKSYSVFSLIWSHPIHIYEFYKQRFTHENYFRDSNVAFEIGKMPSQLVVAQPSLFMVESSNPKCSFMV